MSDSQQPKPAVPLFEVPDLELELAPRSRQAAHSAPRLAAPNLTAQGRGYTAPNLFEDDDALGGGGRTFDLGLDGGGGAAHFGGGASIEAGGDFELDPTVHPGLALDHDAAPPSAGSFAAGKKGGATGAVWPTGKEPERERLAIDSLELALLANYGEAPKSVYLAPIYALRVFTRQRELKRALVPLEAERARAEAEREHVLADLARAVRPEAEKIEQFRRLFAPLVELEQVASQRGQALSSVNAEIAGQGAAIDAELAALSERLAAEQAVERTALSAHDERDAIAKRAEMKLKRVHIEIRAITQVAEQKLGQKGGKVPEPEAAQLSVLKQRAEAVQPEVIQAKAALDQARVALGQVQARVLGVQQSERQILRKKLALAQHFQKELQVRSEGLSESEATQRAALADLGRAILAARGSVAVDDAWRERIKGVSLRADGLLLRCETQLRALDAYDRELVRRGVRLAVTIFAIFFVLLALKLAL